MRLWRKRNDNVKKLAIQVLKALWPMVAEININLGHDCNGEPVLHAGCHPTGIGENLAGKPCLDDRLGHRRPDGVDIAGK